MNFDEEHIHNWFGLTYSSYLVLPRLMLESMPAEWQKKFVELLDEMEETLEVDENYSSEYSVQYKVDGKFASDPYRDYRRGERLKIKEDNA